MADDSIHASTITSSNGTLIPPSEFFSPDQMAILQNPAKCDLLGKIYHKEFYRNQVRSHLDNAIFCARTTVEICPPESPLRGKYLLRLGNWLVSRCDRYDQTVDLDEALQLLEESLKDGDEDHVGSLRESQRAEAFSSVARCHRLRYLDIGSQYDFDCSLEASKNALEIYYEIGHDKKIAEIEHNVALLFEDRFWKTKESTGSLDHALEWAQRAVASSEGLEIWHECIKTMSGLCEGRFSAMINQDYLHAAIRGWEELFVAQDSEPLRAAYQFELGRVYFHLTKITESPDDGSEASSNIKAALQCTPNDDPTRPERLRLWDECFKFLSDTVGFDVRGRTTNAEIKEQKKKISFWASEQDPVYQAKLLEELSSMYYERYQSGQKICEAIAATETMKEAIELTPEDQHKELAHRLRIIAFTYDELYKDTDNTKYLDDGLLWARKAAEICEKSENIENSLKALTLHTAARILSDKINEDSPNDKTMMIEAVTYAERAVELISEYCNGNDNCEHCKDRTMYVEDLKEFRRTYHYTSVVSSSGHGDRSAEHASEQKEDV
jgi:hypothetical protein